MSTSENVRRALDSDECQRLKAEAEAKRRERIVKRYKNGDTVAQIAESMGCGEHRVRAALEAAGITMPPRTPKPPNLKKIIRTVRAKR